MRLSTRPPTSLAFALASLYRSLPYSFRTTYSRSTKGLIWIKAHRMSSMADALSAPKTATAAVQQPPWHAPTPQDTSYRTGLKVNNSLTRSKVEFIPSNGGKYVSWYTCGPTVYDAAHMGHARSYIVIDILRRIMDDYLGYNVNLVMNITDIDDKIILRARQAFLLKQYQAAHPKVTDEVRQTIWEAWRVYVQKAFAKTIPDAQARWTDFQAMVAANDPRVVRGEKFDMQYALASDVHARLNDATRPTDDLLAAAGDVLAPYLDTLHGAEMTDHAIFRTLTQHYEASFMKDMAALHVRPCTLLTRVSEYVPEIVEYVETIIKNGFAYEADGSVYFDVAAFSKTHDYAKLAPWSKHSTELMQDGEGSLGNLLTGKRSPSDFALWKKSKAGEPFWDSPWGQGRPGWHIECSAMASATLGGNFDIHSGGIDLCFPHHDNELAQAEAYHGCQQWVNYFLHAGHLHIAGQKMSKSLKNFVTIEEALQTWTANQIRILFLKHAWDAVLDYKEESMQAAANVERTFINFFSTVKALMREVEPLEAISTDRHHFKAVELDLRGHLVAAQEAVHAALLNSFDTGSALMTMLDLVNKTNTYIKERTQQSSRVNGQLLRQIAQYLTRMLSIFGLDTSRLTVSTGSGSGESDTIDKESIVMPYVQVLSTFRDNIRSQLRSGEALDAKQLLALCDTLRDVDLVELGVAMEDREGSNTALIKMVDRDTLLAERAAKLAMQAEKAASKAKAAAEQARQRQEKLMRGKNPPAVHFAESGLYSQYDATSGIPTHDAAGEELSKNAKKKIQKEWDMQTKAHAEYLKAKEAGLLPP